MYKFLYKVDHFIIIIFFFLFKLQKKFTNIFYISLLFYQPLMTLNKTFYVLKVKLYLINTELNIFIFLHYLFIPIFLILLKFIKRLFKLIIYFVNIFCSLFNI